MQETPRKELSLLDSTCLIVGIIIGTGIYTMSPDIAKGAGGGWGVMAIWLVGGLISLCGALGYAELASAYPREGGDYVYLSRAFGRWAGFLFGWVRMAIVQPGDIAVMAFFFAVYAAVLYDPLPQGGPEATLRLYACAAVVVLTAINLIGVKAGKWTQNLLTILKALGLLAIVGVALAAPPGRAAAAAVESRPWSLALILVLFAFGGWNEMAYVAAEVKNPRRNILRALVLGTAAVTALYLLVNAAFLYTLGYEGLALSTAPAADSIAAALPTAGGRILSAMICLSTLGAANGLVLTGARISYAVGAEHRAFRALGQWHPRTGTPVRALLVQGAIAVTLILALGSFVEAVLYTAAPVYLFFVATSAALIVLRVKEPGAERPYRVTAYPVPVILFAGVCGFLLYSAVTYKPLISAAATGILLLGLPIYWLTSRRGAPAAPGGGP
jgi:amino acid transporter